MRRIDVAAAAAASLALALALTGCAPEPAPSSSSASPSNSITSPSPLETSHTDDSPSPTPTAEAAAKLPTDCRAILSPAVLAQFAAVEGVRLNEPSFGDSGVQKDGSLTCIWANKGATNMLTTKVSRMSRGPALELLNGLASRQGFTCYTPDGGTRCEHIWDDTAHHVTDGRTVFWRGDVLIDTFYVNLSPSGYTASIVAHVFG